MFAVIRYVSIHLEISAMARSAPEDSLTDRVIPIHPFALQAWRRRPSTNALELLRAGIKTPPRSLGSLKNKIRQRLIDY